MGAPRHSIVSRLAETSLVCDYQKAFTQTTGLSLSLESIEARHPTLPNEKTSLSCFLSRKLTACPCRKTQPLLHTPMTLCCEAGLCETKIPIGLKDQQIGYLCMEYVLLEKPTSQKFKKILHRFSKKSLHQDLKTLEKAYLALPTLSPSSYEGIVGLLTLFAKQLSSVIESLQLEPQSTTPPFIRKGQDYMIQHYEENLSLQEISTYLHLSSKYFCSIFKKSTGMTFTEYLTRIRLEKAKHLLSHSHHQISAIAFDVGFRSLSQFNRSFRKWVGVCPRNYRLSRSAFQTHLPS